MERRIGDRQQHAGPDQKTALPDGEHPQRLGREAFGMGEHMAEPGTDDEGDDRPPAPGREPAIDLSRQHLAGDQEGGDGKDRREAAGREDQRPQDDCVHVIQPVPWTPAASSL